MSRSTIRGSIVAFALAAAPLTMFAQAAPPATKTPSRAPQTVANAPMPLAASYDPALYSGLRYRMIGPLRGGRVTAVTGVPSNPQLYYMGSTGGGIWKTADAGHSWGNISDGFLPVGSMGAIEVSQSNPNVIYAGTGSSKIRSNVSIGRGMYKSTDAGKTWTFMRTCASPARSRPSAFIPTNPDIVYVAALGNPFMPNNERGVFDHRRRQDLEEGPLSSPIRLGAADLELQPGQSESDLRLDVARERKPWTIISGAQRRRHLQEHRRRRQLEQARRRTAARICSAAATSRFSRRSRIASTR